MYAIIALLLVLAFGPMFVAANGKYWIMSGLLIFFIIAPIVYAVTGSPATLLLSAFGLFLISLQKETL